MLTGPARIILDPSSPTQSTDMRKEKATAFKMSPARLQERGMHETWLEAGEIIPSSGRQNRKLNITSFLEKKLESLNFRALGRLFTERCCSWFFVLSFIFLPPPRSVYEGLKCALSRLAFCWVSSCYFSSRLYF